MNKLQNEYMGVWLDLEHDMQNWGYIKTSDDPLRSFLTKKLAKLKKKMTLAEFLQVETEINNRPRKTSFKGEPLPKSTFPN